MKNDILIHHWNTWKGNVLCSHSQKLFTAEELRYLTEKTAKKLKTLGIKPGEAVALVLSNTVAFPVCLMALLELEANPFPLHANTTKDEIKKVSEVININWILKDDVPFKTNVVNYENFSVEKINLFLYRSGNELISIPETGVILHQTSGTYGKPLQCIRNQEVAVAEAVNYMSSVGTYNNIKVRFTTPLNHAFAYGFGLISSIITDSTLIIDTVFNPKKILKEETENVSDALCVVPPMLRPLIYLKQKNDSLKLPRDVYYAGTMCDAPLMNKFEKTFGSRLFAILGSTETGAIACSNVNDTKAKGVGKILNNVEVLIKNASHYKDLGNNVGELFVKSTAMMQRYCHESTNTKIDYFPTGDLVVFDENNDLHIIGRIKDIINVGGVKVDPVEVEKILLEHSGVTDATVYPGRSDNGNETVLAAVSLSLDLNESDIIAYCLKHLNDYKVPSKINILAEIPRTPSGKCLKTNLPGYSDNRIFKQN